MMKLFFSFLLLSSCTYAQNDVEIHFLFSFHELPLRKGEWYVTNSGDSVQIQTVKFFVSQKASNSNDIQADAVKLVDWSLPETHKWYIKMKDKADLKITFGLDSIYHVSEIMEGDLNPSLGMYWAWQSGYIQLKIEGVSPRSPSRNHKFQYHIGGYIQPFNVARELNYGSINASRVNLVLKLESFFNQISIEQTPEIMIPGNAAMHFIPSTVKFLELIEGS